MASPFKVVVLTCGELGFQTAAALAELSHIDVTAILTSPYPRGSFRSRLRRARRRHGIAGAAALAVRKLARLTRWLPREEALPDAPAPHLHFASFHSAECLAALRRLDPDLGVIDGTYILRESVFGLPRYGSINLHCGKVPEYRGSPPVFWELYDGIDSVGITIHQVTAGLDEGPVLSEEAFPLNTRPAGDPVKFAHRFWQDVLRPNGVRMLTEAVAAIGDGTATPRPQSRTEAKTRRTPTIAEVRELRRRVRARQVGHKRL